MERTLEHERPSTARPLATPTSRLLRIVARVSLWRRNLRTRRQLAELDERLLADAGISAAERVAELRKPFWR